jgi:hypothetical protein
LLLLFFSLLGLPNLVGADTGASSFFNQVPDNGIGFNIQENLGSVADDKYWKDIFKTDELTGTVKALVKDSAGNLYVGGLFTTAGGNPASNIALWNGSAWSTLGTGLSKVPGPGPSVNALAVYGTNLYVGGTFTFYDGDTAKVNNIAKWDGTKWSALGSGVDATVSALTVVGPGNLFAGGQFALAGGKSSAFIGQWNKESLHLPLIVR